MEPQVNFGMSEIKSYIQKFFEEELERKFNEFWEAKLRFREEKLRELSLLERIIRVEEELKALKEIQIQMINMFNARFEALQREMDKRFEAMEKRFEAMDKRFEAMEKRFDFLQKLIAGGFAFLTLLITLFKFFS